jgi:hypothetical protein
MTALAAERNSPAARLAAAEIGSPRLSSAFETPARKPGLVADIQAAAAGSSTQPRTTWLKPWTRRFTGSSGSLFACAGGAANSRAVAARRGRKVRARILGVPRLEAGRAGSGAAGRDLVYFSFTCHWKLNNPLTLSGWAR